MAHHKRKDPKESKAPKLPKKRKTKPIDELPPVEEKAPDLFPDNLAPQMDGAPTPDECAPKDEPSPDEPQKIELPLPVHPDCPVEHVTDLDVVHIPHEPGQCDPLAAPVKLSRCPVAVWQMPWGTYVVLAAPPGDASALDGLKDGQFVDVDLHPAVSIEAEE